MHDRLDDLFILDAEQAAKELLIYGEGRSDVPTERLSGTTEYLAPLLQSCGLIRHADACMLFGQFFNVADEGQIRRVVREFAELSLQSLEALKTGSTINEVGRDAVLEQLIVRLQQFSPNPSQTLREPSPSRFRQFDSHHADPDRELIANAFRAIEAVDSLAVMIAQEAQGHADPGTDDYGALASDNEPTGLTDGVTHTKAEAVSGEFVAAQSNRSEAVSINPDEGTGASQLMQKGVVADVGDTSNPVHAEALDGSACFETSLLGSDRSNGPAPSETPLASIDQDALDLEIGPTISLASTIKSDPTSQTLVVQTQQTETAGPVVDLTSLAKASLEKSGPSSQEVHPGPQKLIDVVLRNQVASVQIDAAFRKALRLSHDGPWVQGMTTLLESIDILDHVSLRDALPSELSLLGGNEISVQPELARMLKEEFQQARVAGVGDAMLVSQTLILAIQHDRLVLADRLAKQIAFQGGRIEVDTTLKRWRIVVPASARLLRISQLQVDGVWLAVPWAQFLGLEGRAPRQEAQLCIGNESDKIRVEALGLVSTGVRFDLPRPLRRRERYRGLVMLANADCLPVYA